MFTFIKLLLGDLYVYSWVSVATQPIVKVTFWLSLFCLEKRNRLPHGRGNKQVMTNTSVKNPVI